MELLYSEAYSTAVPDSSSTVDNKPLSIRVQIFVKYPFYIEVRFQKKHISGTHCASFLQVQLGQVLIGAFKRLFYLFLLKSIILSKLTGFAENLQQQIYQHDSEDIFSGSVPPYSHKQKIFAGTETLTLCISCQSTHVSLQKHDSQYLPSQML